ncbi:MAG: D-alanine--D-alanine ligase family protein [bacterium]
MSAIKLWLLCGGPSPEHEVSLLSSLTVAQHLDLSRFPVKPVYITREGLWVVGDQYLGADITKDDLNGRFRHLQEMGFARASQGRSFAEAMKDLERDPPDVVFLGLHGAFGEDGTVQGLLETAGLPYTGSGILASALAMDKARCQKFLKSQKIPIPKFVEINTGLLPKLQESVGDLIESGLGFPCFVKPSRGGSSVGVGIARNKPDLERLIVEASEVDESVLVEEYLTGVEVSCGVLEQLDESGNRIERVLIPTEIHPLEAEFFDYDSKYVPGKSQEITPARLPDDQLWEIQRLALETHKLVGCSGYSRTDLIVTKNGPKVLEINTLPGMTPTSLLPQGAAALNISYSQVLESLIFSALARAKQSTTETVRALP